MTTRFEEVLKRFINLLHQPVFLLDQDALIVDLNFSAEKIFKINKHETLHKPISFFCPDFNSKQLGIPLFVKLSATANAQQILFHPILLKKSKNGIQYILVGSADHGAKSGNQGKDESLHEAIASLTQMLTGQLIDKNKNALEHVKNIYHYMENIIAEIPVSVYWMNKDCVYLGCSNSMARLLNLKSRHEIVGKTYADLYDEISASYYKKADQEVMSQGVSLSLEEPMYHPNGRKEIYLSKKVPLCDPDGNLIGMLGISVNITDRKEMEENLRQAKMAAEAANQAKTEFLENMRHDIRTPLTGIVGFADILEMESDNPQVKEYAENLVASSHALLDLLDEVLEAIRVSSGEIPRLKKKFNLQKTLQQIIELNRAKAAQKKLKMTFNYDSQIPRYLIGDKIRIHRIALELVANALNFTDTGYVKLTATLAQQDHRELIIKLVVEDSGIGIPKDKQQEIFLQFKRLTPSYQGIYKGAGLGLSVIKQFVDELNGEIYVESEVGKGTRFTCLLPLQQSLLNDEFGVDDEMEKVIDKPYETTYAQEIKPSQKASNQTQYRVLVVEDNPIAQTVAKSILAQLNCQADIAESGNKAVEMWKAGAYDLIFMDIGLPDIDGYQVTHLIRVQELAKKSHTPIIALTAHAGDENKKRCIDAGMNAVLTKPLTVKSCTDIVDAFIPGKHPHKTQESLNYFSDLPQQTDELFNLSPFPLLDIKEGIKTTGSKTALADMLTFMVNESLPDDLAAMKKAHAAQDWDKTQQLAHKIKGGAVYVGTVRIKMACQYLERYWKTGQRNLLEELYQQILKVIEESLSEISHWLERY
ncbi:PAS domain-containing sensor histidine kinase [Legionella maceachernii]|uniref:histidine kinase n=1 Tax=Legionella maceachernii TaxID=466 RepID=A0A0W0W3T9_9GAMM|nr:PAS domain-containing sensor histidine kinase [Legionella maceachernii]KTD27032.1 sensory histidine-kinase / response regulator [Legionella maceachernii]SKA03619.1 Signal transduction histidine kinase [Legionella maceachernii]SUP00194.1 Aerobic respiration control sensor protein ArcB [Legionella maceachernii]